MVVTPIKRVAPLKPATNANLTDAHAQAIHRSIWLVGSVESLLKRHSTSGEMHFLLLQRANGEWLRCKWPAGTLPSSLPELGQVIRIEVELEKTAMSTETIPLTDSKICYLIRAWRCNQTPYSTDWLERVHLAAANEAALDRLWSVIQNLTHNELRGWLFELFAQPDFCLPFIQVAASHSHHHSHAGGLLLHSVECAEWVAQVAQHTLNPKEAALAIVAALLHDAGKIVTMQPIDGQPTVAHEVLTLTVLEPALSRLQQQWSAGAFALRQMLSWSPHYEKFPRLPGTVLVKMADQYSTALSARHKAFETLPSHYYYWAKLQTSSCMQMFNRIN